MAITRHLAQFILAEHRYRPIGGNILLLGRQMVFLTPDEAQELIEGNGISIRPGANIEYDKTVYGSERGYISDTSFFSLFTDGFVQASDVSDYEGADIVFDLSDPPPEKTLNAYDFVYNGSVLDNVFNPAACIQNASRMLKPSGVMMSYEGAAHSDPAYLKFTNDWFFDYYAINNFSDFQGYLCTYNNVHTSSWAVFEWQPFTKLEPAPEVTWPMKVAQDAMVVILAEKSPSATISVNPIQGVYRQNHGPYVAASKRFSASKRRDVFRSCIQAQVVESTAAGTTPTPNVAQGSAAKSDFKSRLIAAGRASPLKTLVPRKVKSAILSIGSPPAPAEAAATTAAADASPDVKPGYTYLGTVG